jgi:hypothetical protein
MLRSEADQYPEHLQALGLITVHFALLEFTMASFVWALLDADDRTGSIVTAPQSFRNLTSLVSALFQEKQHDAGHVKELNELLAKIAGLEERRNEITHSLWGRGDGKETLIREKVTARRGKGYKLITEEVRAESLQAIGADLLEVTSELYAFKQRFGYIVGRHL